ncbi:hypothetical protein [Aestuariivivens insulae]|uniref:hypothetical protein n=1 Tax=Aestuariivivens insulae TaxID=1621988 RepID=UPI001F58B16E|nr:hypothetical protein [Aestuariivivens insulae]
MTVRAVANPHNIHKEPAILHNRAVGYGVVTFNKKDRTIKTECYRRFDDPLEAGSQYPGWPQTVLQEANYARKANGYLPEITVKGIENPVFQITNEKTMNMEYAIRINGQSFVAKVFDDSASYTIKVGEPDKNLWQEQKGFTVNSDSVDFVF